MHNFHAIHVRLNSKFIRVVKLGKDPLNLSSDSMDKMYSNFRC